MLTYKEYKEIWGRKPKLEPACLIVSPRMYDIIKDWDNLVPVKQMSLKAKCPDNSSENKYGR